MTLMSRQWTIILPKLWEPVHGYESKRRRKQTEVRPLPHHHSSRDQTPHSYQHNGRGRGNRTQGAAAWDGNEIPQLLLINYHYCQGGKKSSRTWEHWWKSSVSKLLLKKNKTLVCVILLKFCEKGELLT